MRRRSASTSRSGWSTSSTTAASCFELSRHTSRVDELVQRVEEHVRRHELIAPGGEVLCLVSGGADSTCLWGVLRELGYRVSALHVAHGLRSVESDEDARFCARELGAEVVDAPGAGKSEA